MGFLQTSHLLLLVLGRSSLAQDELVSGKPVVIQLAADNAALAGHGPSREFTYRAESDGVIYLSAFSRDVDTFLHVESTEGEVLAEDDNSGGGKSAFKRMEVTDGAELWITIAAAQSGKSGNVTVKLVALAKPDEAVLREVAVVRGLLRDARVKQQGKVYDQARKLLRDAIDHLVALPELTEASLETLKEAADLARDLQDLQASKLVEERAWRFRESVLPDDHADLQAARLYVADTKWRLGDLKGALTLNEKVFEVRSRTLPDDHPDLQAARNNLAVTKGELGDLKGALELEQKVFDVLSRTLPDDHPDLQTARQSLAATSVGLGDLKGALALEQKVYEVRSRTLPDDHPDLQAARNNLAITKGDLGDLKGALELQEKVYEVRSRKLPDDHPDLQRARLNLAATKGKLGDLNGEVELQEKAYEVLSRKLPDDHPDLQRARLNLAATRAHMGTMDRCRHLLLEAADGQRSHQRLVSSLLSPRAQDEARRENAYLIDCLFSYRDPASLSGQSSAEELNALIALRGSVDRQARIAEILGDRVLTDQELKKLVTEARATRALYLRAFESTDCAQSDTLPKLRQEMERAEEALTRRAATLPGVQELFHFPPLSELAAQLPEDAAAIMTAAYTRFFARNRTENSSPDPQLGIAAFVVARTGEVRRIDLEHPAEILDLCSSFRNELEIEVKAGHVGPSLGERPGKRLSRLLQPLWQALPEGTHKLFVCPDQALAAIPWEALAHGGKGALADHFDVAYIENLTALNPRMPGRGDATLLVFGGIDYGGSPVALGENRRAPETSSVRRGTGTFQALAGTLPEAVAIEKTFEETHPTARAMLLKGSEASRASFVNLAPEFRFVHLATHAFVAPEQDWKLGEESVRSGVALSARERAVGFDRGLLSGIVFSGANLPADGSHDSSVLTATELSGLDLSQCDLAVLSACETNVGPRYFGEAVSGLNRALQLAGARHTITSLWKVDDQGTAVFFNAFYDALWSKNLPVAQAFQAARQRVRAQGYGPAVWAAFVLYTTGVAC
ncbi:MAG: CHAT domain-containing tetratricopeptide repeat protein [Planctomycetota bacterium]